MSTSTSSGPGSGSGTDSTVRTSGPPWDRRTTARTAATYSLLRRSLHGSLETRVDRVQELLGRLERLVGTDQEGEILGHPSALHRLDADALERLGELGDLWRAVLVAAE